MRVALARLLDRRRAHRARRRPALRDARRPVATTTTRSSPPAASSRGGFGDAMEAVGYSESAPPLYYALAWVWTQLTGTGEFGLRSLSALAGVATVPVAYLLGAELRGRRAGIVAAALVAVNPMLLWYSQEARGYALFALLCARSRCSTSSARSSAAARRDVDLAGESSRRWPSPPTTSRSSRSRPRRSGCCARRGRARGQGHLDRRPRRPGAGAAALHQMVARARRMDRRPRPRPPALGDRRDLPGRRDRRHHRPARAPAAGRWCPFLLVVAALVPDRRPRATGDERRAARPAAGAGRGDGRRSRWRWRSLAPARTTSSPATCCPRWCRCWSRWRSASPCAARAAPALLVGAALVAYSLGFCDLGQRLAGAAAARLGRGRRRSSANRPGRGRSSPGRWARPRCATTCRPAPSRCVQSEGYPLVRARDRLRLRRPGAAGPAQPAGARLPPGRLRAGRPPLPAPLRAAGPGPDPPAAARRCATPTSTSAATASSSTGSGRAGSRTSRVRRRLS